MEKLKMHTPNITAENIEKLGALFPDCVTEIKDDKTGQLKRAIDFDQLRQELSDHIVDGPRERYHLDWPGKREALLAANAPIAKTLRPCREKSVDFDTTKNLFIEGDNLEALKLLQETYLEKVKLIYIDPPYNTGNDFIYDDDFAIDAEAYMLRSNQTDTVGNRLIVNTESNGRFHSDWLTMLYSRLRLARNFLDEEGFIVVSIDDAEIENTKALLNEVFGKKNEIAVLVWDRNRKNDAKFVSVGHEYMCIYAKNKQRLIDKKTVLREPKPGLDEARTLFERLSAKHHKNWDLVQAEWRKFYGGLKDSDERKKLGRFSKVCERGPYRDDGDISWPGGGGPKYEVLHPKTNKPCKVPNGGWVYPSKERFDEAVKAGRVVFGQDETTLPRQARYLLDGEGQVMPSVFYSYAQTATMEFVELMGERIFENPKNWKDLRRVFSYLTRPDSIVMDFFAGSCSSVHALLQLNACEATARRYIVIQMPEECDQSSAAYKAGFRNLCELGRARIRKCAEVTREMFATTAASLDIGFRVLKIDTSNVKDVHYAPDEVNQDQLTLHTDNIKEDRTPEDLLFQVLVDWGVDLALPVTHETIAGKAVFFVDGNALAACFDPNISERLVKELAKRKPLRAVFRDSSYDSDSTKINVEQIFKLLSPETEVKSL